MVRTHGDTQKLDNLYKRNKKDKKKGETILIESDFQRGDEESGVWLMINKQVFIDSLQNNYPVGILTFVIDEDIDESCWKTLDGGNRLRAIRDYKDNKFVDKLGRKYENLSCQEQANFDSLLIPCQWITIESDDIPEIITEMFTRLNTSAKPLSQGELCKAHGWKKDVFELELAKKIIGDTWSSSIIGYDKETSELREKWNTTFQAELRETKRCDILAATTGFIMSAKTGNFTTFEKKYCVLKNKFTKMTDYCVGDVLNIYQKLNTFCDVMSKVYDKNIFGKVTMGMAPMSRVAPIWKMICEDKWNEKCNDVVVKFYKKMLQSYEIRREYENILKKDGDNHHTSNKISLVIKYIFDTRLTC